MDCTSPRCALDLFALSTLKLLLLTFVLCAELVLVGLAGQRLLFAGSAGAELLLMELACAGLFLLRTARLWWALPWILRRHRLMTRRRSRPSVLRNCRGTRRDLTLPRAACGLLLGLI